MSWLCPFMFLITRLYLNTTLYSLQLTQRGKKDMSELDVPFHALEDQVMSSAPVDRRSAPVYVLFPFQLP